MKYNVGDKVRIKSLDWYNKNKNKTGDVPCGEYDFVSDMSVFCGKILTIDVDFGNKTYLMKEDNNGFIFTIEMIEGLMEEENKPKFKVGDEVRIKGTDIGGTIESVIRGQLIVNSKGSKIPAWPEDVVLMKSMEEEILDKAGQITDFEYEGLAYSLPTGYQFVDENGNTINATKISLRKKKEVIPNIQLDSIRTVREYDTAHSRIWLEIYEDNPEICIFTHLLVDKDHRKKGYGTKAIEQAEIIAKDLGCDTIHLKVETNSWMHNWYLRYGYKFLTNAEDNYTWLTKSI